MAHFQPWALSPSDTALPFSNVSMFQSASFLCSCLTRGIYIYMYLYIICSLWVGQVNGTSLEPGTTKDAFLELLIETPRPVCIGFRLQKV